MIKAESWTYASGRVAALEGQLLPAEAFERLAEAPAASAAAALPPENPLRAALAEARTPSRAAEIVGAYYAVRIESLRRDCPDPAMFELLDLPARYRELKARLRAALSAPGGGQRGRELPADLAGAAGDGEAGRAVALLGAALAQGDAPDPELAVDLLCDSARLAEMLRLAGSAGGPDVAGCVADEVRVRSALAVWRGRLLAANEGPASPTGLWLPRLFLRGALASGLAGRLWDAEFPAWPGLLSAELSESLAGEVFGGGDAGHLSGWERAAFALLGTRVRALRSAAFGPGRVWAYVWALRVEEHNVRLALVGRMRGVAAAAVRGLLWETADG